MESKKRKIEKMSRMGSQSKREKRNSEKLLNVDDMDKVCTVTLHWSKKNSAYLLKCIYRRVKLLGNNDVNDDQFWRDIESDMKQKFAWVFIAVCQEKWKKLREEAEKYINDHLEPQPDFFYVVREIVRMINKKNRGFKDDDDDNEDEDVSLIRGFSVADPDAVKLEPFAGVMDSMGNMYLHEPLFEIANSFEALPECTDIVLSEKHGVEEAIVEWVRENQESILRGSLQCSTCNKCILKRDAFIEHELDCFLASHQCKSDDGGFEISYEQSHIDEPWSAETISVLIKTFREKSPSYVSSNGLLRPGIWMEIYKALRPLEAKITPPMCREKWTELVDLARDYSDALKENNGEITEPVRPRFYSDISEIVDLENVESGSSHCYIPKELIPEDKGDNLTPRVFLSRESDHDESEFDDEESEGEEMIRGIDENSALWSDEESSDIKSKKKSRLYLDHKVTSLSVRVKTLEEENTALRKQHSDNFKTFIPGVLSRLDQIVQQQKETQTRQTEVLKDMASMFERHHKECIEVIRSLEDKIFKGKNTKGRKL